MEGTLNVDARDPAEKRQKGKEVQRDTHGQVVGIPVKPSIGSDMWKQLKRVSIPTFSGNKTTYESWKAAFNACIDCAPATPEYKLLQLRQYLSGEALKCIENLGHSAAAYEAARSRLNRKYGGKRRQIALYIEDLDRFKPIRIGNSKDVEKFADLLDVAVINLEDARRYEELGTGSLYVKLQRKLPETMLTNYHRWLYENDKFESVVTLRDWVIMEAEFHIIAAETIKGISGAVDDPGKQKGRSMHTNRDKDTKRKCRICDESHGAWACSVFKSLDASRRWQLAKEKKLCYCCLADNHMSKECPRRRLCPMENCKSHHHKLLHDDNFQHKEKKEEDKKSADSVEKTELPKATHFSNKPMEMSLRTVPVVLKHGNSRIIVNALLDDGSTESYINGDVTAQLGAPVGEVRRINVNVLNGHVETFETVPTSVTLESLDGKIKIPFTATTTDKVTGSLKAIEWNKHKERWKHLKDLMFPTPAKKNFVDVLIGLDYGNLHSSLEEKIGKIGEPVARLTPLGWTCIGCPMESLTCKELRTFFTRTNETTFDDVNRALRKFWEIENSGVSETATQMSLEEKSALHLVKESLTWVDGKYEVGIPWKDEKVPELNNNYNMAVKRLICTERKLQKQQTSCETILRDVKMDWKRDYGVAKRFYKTLKWTGNVIMELRNDYTRR